MIAHSPIVARVVIISERLGIISAELNFRPYCDMEREVCVNNLLQVRLVRSDGVHQGISPSQKSARRVLGVPPLLIWPTSPSCFTDHSPANPGSLLFPVSNSCMAPCLICRFLTMLCSRASMRASASERAVAMILCSSTDGKGIASWRNFVVGCARAGTPVCPFPSSKLWRPCLERKNITTQDGSTRLLSNWTLNWL